MIPLSMYSQAVLSQLHKTTICPGCGEMNHAGRKQMLDLMDDWTVYCNKCGLTFEAERPRVEPVG